MSANYVCKTCGTEISYPARQDQDEQPLVKIDQGSDSVVIRVWPTEWVYDEQGRPHQIINKALPIDRIDHHCGQTTEQPHNPNYPS
jgi:hypothetical protein